MASSTNLSSFSKGQLESISSLTAGTIGHNIEHLVSYLSGDVRYRANQMHHRASQQIKVSKETLLHLHMTDMRLKIVHEWISFEVDLMEREEDREVCSHFIPRLSVSKLINSILS
jgi:hypothetical protein